MGKIVHISEKYYTEQQYVEWMELMDDMIEVEQAKEKTTILLIKVFAKMQNWENENKIGKLAIRKMIPRYVDEYPEKAEILKDYFALQFIDFKPRKR
jgi:hypothetical protein